MLPAGLTHLTWGYWFNQPLAVGVLPAGMTHMDFNYSYNRPFAEGVLHVPGLLNLNMPVPFGRVGLSCRRD